MTTNRSPLRVLKAQAEKIAATIKAADRGDPVPATFAEKLAEARERETVRVGIVMDDKVVKIDIAWATIRSTSKAGLTEYILGLMRETRRAVH